MTLYLFHHWAHHQNIPMGAHFIKKYPFVTKCTFIGNRSTFFNYHYVTKIFFMKFYDDVKFGLKLVLQILSLIRLPAFASLEPDRIVDTTTEEKNEIIMLMNFT